MTLAEEIRRINGLSFWEDYDLSKLSTMRLKSRGDFVEIKSFDALQALLPLLKFHQKKYFVLGWGANQILPEHCHDLVLHLDFPFDLDSLNEQKNEYVLPASLGLNHLTSHAVKFGLSGWEVFTGIPASLGGAIFMNAGTSLGEIGDLVKSVRLITPEGFIREELMSKDSFSYRQNHFVQPGEVIVEATLTHHGHDSHISDKIKNYLHYRKTTQPLTTRNCGCVFKNPRPKLSSGKLIDLLGLKNLAVGDLKISSKHGNFFENRGNATKENFTELVQIVQDCADIFYGIEFELEVKIPYHE